MCACVCNISCRPRKQERTQNLEERCKYLHAAQGGRRRYKPTLPRGFKSIRAAMVHTKTAAAVDTSTTAPALHTLAFATATAVLLAFVYVCSVHQEIQIIHQIITKFPRIKIKIKHSSSNLILSHSSHSSITAVLGVNTDAIYICGAPPFQLATPPRFRSTTSRREPCIYTYIMYFLGAWATSNFSDRRYFLVH